MIKPRGELKVSACAFGGAFLAVFPCFPESLRHLRIQLARIPAAAPEPAVVFLINLQETFFSQLHLSGRYPTRPQCCPLSFSTARLSTAQFSRRSPLTLGGLHHRWGALSKGN